MSNLNLSSTSAVSHWVAAVLKAHFGDQREYANAKSSLGFFERHCVSIGKPFAGNMGQPVVDSYKLTLENRQLAPETINKRLHHVSTLFKFMASNNLTLAGKLKGVAFGYVNVPRNKRKWWLGDEEERELFALINKLCTDPELSAEERQRWAMVGDYFEFVCEVGLRVEECLRLLPSDFKDIRTVGSEGLIVPGTKNDDSEAYVPLSLRAAAIARQRIDYEYTLPRGSAPRLFDISYKTLQRAFNYLREQLGWPKTATLKGLRRTFAGRSLRKGLDIRMVQELMRHSSEDSTREYLKLFGLANNPETRAKLNQQLRQGGKVATPAATDFSELEKRVMAHYASIDQHQIRADAEGITREEAKARNYGQAYTPSDSMGDEFADFVKTLRTMFGEDKVMVLGDEVLTGYAIDPSPSPVVHYFPGGDIDKVTCPGCLAAMRKHGIIKDHG